MVSTYESTLVGCTVFKMYIIFKNIIVKLNESLLEEF